MRADIEFLSHGVTIRAWHYQPDSSALQSAAGAPAVVMAHGLSFTRDGGLERYAERFAAAGLHVVVMDYRGFGVSDGLPRDVVSITMQREDYLAAVGATRALDGVDPQRVAVWGSSYSGGCVVEAAARDPRIAAVISQVPNLDSLATGWFLARRRAGGSGSWMVRAIARDVVRGWMRREPYYVKAAGRPGERAAYISDEGMDFIERLAGPTWSGRFAPRDFGRFPPARPIRRIKKLPCRIQLFAAERDELTPAGPVIRAAKLAGERAELHRYPVGHFGIYFGDAFADAVEKQVAFLSSELRVKGQIGVAA